MNISTISEWTTRHNRWSDLEVRELHKPAAAAEALQPALGADPRRRRRFYKGVYYRLTPAWRAIGYFLFRYILQLGFLDGRVGFYYNFLQSLWFRMLVDAKLHEARPPCPLASPDTRTPTPGAR